MVLMTMIARIPDGLPLAASMQDDEQVCFIFNFKKYLKNYYLAHLLIMYNIK